MTPSSPVLVTGGSGFIAGHCILQLLDAGRSVRATLRSTSREASVRETLQQAGATNLDRLEFVAADLTSDDGWDAAMDGVDAVLHVASPVMPGQVKDEQTVISPAREGAVRVIEAARRAGARRVVLTSAFHAAGFGHGPIDHVFTEDDWSPLDGPGMDAYGRSKVLAERAAWDAVADGGPELVTILPVAVVGPPCGPLARAFLRQGLDRRRERSGQGGDGGEGQPVVRDGDHARDNHDDGCGRAVEPVREREQADRGSRADGDQHRPGDGGDHRKPPTPRRAGNHESTWLPTRGPRRGASACPPAPPEAGVASAAR